MPADQSPGRRCCGAQSQTASGSGRSRRKQNKWAARGGPGFIGGDRPAAASPHALGFLMNVKRVSGFWGEAAGGGSRRGTSIDVEGGTPYTMADLAAAVAQAQQSDANSRLFDKAQR